MIKAIASHSHEGGNLPISEMPSLNVLSELFQKSMASYEECSTYLLDKEAWVHLKKPEDFLVITRIVDASIFILLKEAAQRKRQDVRYSGLETAMNNIGTIYYNMGKWDRAVFFFLRALETLEETPCKRNLDLVPSLNNIGACYHSLGLYDNALHYFNRALEIQKSVLNSQDPHIKMSINNVGACIFAIGDHNEALGNFRKTLNESSTINISRETQTDEELSSEAMSYNNIGVCHYSQGESSKALEQFLKAVQRQEATSFGEKHPDLAVSLNNIGTCYCFQRKFDEALIYFEKALKIQESTLGMKHPDLVMSLINIIASYNSQNKSHIVVDYLNRVSEISESKQSSCLMKRKGLAGIRTGLFMNPFFQLLFLQQMTNLFIGEFEIESACFLLFWKPAIQIVDEKRNTEEDPFPNRALLNKLIEEQFSKDITSTDSKEKKVKVDEDVMSRSKETSASLEHTEALELFEKRYEEIKRIKVDRYSDAGLLLNEDGIE